MKTSQTEHFVPLYAIKIANEKRRKEKAKYRLAWCGFIFLVIISFLMVQKVIQTAATQDMEEQYYNGIR